MKDDVMAFIVGIVIGLVLGVVPASIWGDYKHNLLKEDAVKTGHAEWVVIDDKGTVKFQWKSKP
jgi:hypothetical protein